MEEPQSAATSSPTRRAIADQPLPERPTDSAGSLGGPGATPDRRGAADRAAAGARARPSPALSLSWRDGLANAEDGHGARIAAQRALVFDIDAQALGAGARTPELRVGDRVLTRSEYPRPGVLRFVLATTGADLDGVEVTLGYVGSTERLVIAPALEVPR